MVKISVQSSPCFSSFLAKMSFLSVCWKRNCSHKPTCRKPRILRFLHLAPDLSDFYLVEYCLPPSPPIWNISKKIEEICWSTVPKFDSPTALMGAGVQPKKNSKNASFPERCWFTTANLWQCQMPNQRFLETLLRRQDWLHYRGWELAWHLLM